MSPKVIQVRHDGEYRLEFSFDDGLRAKVDFKDRVLERQGIWLPLHDVEYFKKARVGSELQTIVWPSGVDIWPDVLYGLASGKPLPEARQHDPAGSV